MSLINKMLRDLDARLAQPSAGPLPKEVRALPEGAAPRRLGRGIWIFVALAALAYALLQLSDHWLPPARALFEPAPPATAVAKVAVPPPPSKIAAPAQPFAEPPFVQPVAPDASPEPLAQSSDSVPADTQAGSGAARLPAASRHAASAQRIPPKGESPASVAKLGAEKSHAIAAPKVGREVADAPPTIERGLTAADKIEQEFRKGVSAYQQGHPSEAAIQFKAILAETPRHLGARQTLLSMYAEQRRWEEAQNLLKEGLSLLPTHIDWAMALARIQAENGQTEEAWLTLQRHGAYAEERAEYQGFAGVLLQRLQRPSEATVRFRAAARLKPGEGRWWLGLGTALEADGHAAEAREAFLRARASEGLTSDMTAFLDKKLR